MKWKLCKQYLLQHHVQRLITLWLRTILYFCLSVLWWLKTVLQCRFIHFTYFPTYNYSIISENTTFLKHFFPYLWFGNIFYTYCRAVAVGLLEGLSGNCWQHLIMFITFCHFSCAKSGPALALICLLRLSICALFMCVLSYCVLVHGQYWGQTQAGCSIKQYILRKLLWMIDGLFIENQWRDHISW